MFWHPWENMPVPGNKSQKISICACPFANTRQQKPLKIILWFYNIYSVIFSSNNEECHQLKSSGCRVLPVSGSVYTEVSLMPKAIHAQQRLPKGVMKAACPLWAHKKSLTVQGKRMWGNIYAFARVDAKLEAGKLPSLPRFLSCLAGTYQWLSVPTWWLLVRVMVGRDNSILSKRMQSCSQEDTPLWCIVRLAFFLAAPRAAGCQGIWLWWASVLFGSVLAGSCGLGH